MAHLSHVYPFGSFPFAMVLSILIYFVLNGISLYIVIDNFETSPNGFTHHVLFHIACDQYLICYYFQLYFFYFHVYLPILTPILHCFILIIICWIHYLCLTVFKQCLKNCIQNFCIEMNHGRPTGNTIVSKTNHDLGKVH